MKPAAFVLLAALAAAPAMAAPVPDDKAIAAAEQHVKEKLKDPNSAQFRRVVVVRDRDGGATVCGEVNARNAFGGYTGFSAFVTMLGGDTADPMTFLADERGPAERAMYASLAKDCPK